MNNVKAKCRICGNLSPSDQFKLHFELRQMVCPSCFKTGGKQPEKVEKVQENVSNKPAGWDKEDEYLEKATKIRKSEQNSQFRKIPGTTHVQCTCSNCRYEFKYDPFRKKPQTCPYCNGPIPRFKTFSMM